MIHNFTFLSYHLIPILLSRADTIINQRQIKRASNPYSLLMVFTCRYLRFRDQRVRHVPHVRPGRYSRLQPYVSWDQESLLKYIRKDIAGIATDQVQFHELCDKFNFIELLLNNLIEQAQWLF